MNTLRLGHGVLVVFGLLLCPAITVHAGGLPADQSEKSAAAALVERVRASEAWFAQVPSVYVRVRGRLERSQRWLECRRQELAALSGVDANAVPTNTPAFAPMQPLEREIAWDATRVFLRDEQPGGPTFINWWNDGVEFSLTFESEQPPSAVFASKPMATAQVLPYVTWPRSGALRWEHPVPGVTPQLPLRAAGDFVEAAPATVNGVACRVVRTPDGAETWHVDEHNCLRRLTSRTQVEEHPRTPTYCGYVLEWHDYQSIPDGGRYPMQHRETLLYRDTDGTEFEAIHREWNVECVRVGAELPPRLFSYGPPIGAKVLDRRQSPPLEYTYDMRIDPAALNAAREQAEQRQQTTEAMKAALDARLQQPWPGIDPDAAAIIPDEAELRIPPGTIVLLHHWAIWCGPCKNDLAELRQRYDQLKRAGIVVIGVHAAGSDLEAVKRAIKDYDIPYPVVVDNAGGADQSLGRMHAVAGISALPTSWVIDRDGRYDSYSMGAVNDAIVRAVELANGSR